MIVFYDLETTSSKVESCKIVEMCFASEEGIILNERVNPGCLISQEATDVHGISNTDVVNQLLFADYAIQVQETVDQATVLVGYNNFKFDSPVLDRELTEAGFPGLRKDGFGLVNQPEADLFSIWNRHERRDLVTAARRFADYDLEDAHAASADTTILPAVMEGMWKQLGLEGLSLLDAAIDESMVDREGKFHRREDGTIVFNFGKLRDQPVSGNEARGYMEWMLKSSFSPEVKAWCRRLINL